MNSTPGNLEYAPREAENPDDGHLSQEVINVAKEKGLCPHAVIL